jgi:hypothetical protein
MNDLAQRLSALLSKVRLTLDTTDLAVLWEGRRYPITDLCLDDVDMRAVDAELMAVAAAIDAAVKYPGRQTPGEDLRKGAATLLPKLERARFGRAYDSVVLGRGGDLAVDGLYRRDFGGGLIVAYVQDEGWKFNYIPNGRVAQWDASPDTVHSVARSNLYHRAALDHKTSEVALGDGYDAARGILIDDVFFDRVDDTGCELAIPGRDLLIVGQRGRHLDRAIVAQAHQLSKYPLSPEVFVFKGHRVAERATLSD